jgi:hypothetical protein
MEAVKLESSEVRKPGAGAVDWQDERSGRIVSSCLLSRLVVFRVETLPAFTPAVRFLRSNRDIEHKGAGDTAANDCNRYYGTILQSYQFPQVKTSEAVYSRLGFAPH